MKVSGIVAEYNPFHNGHLYHLNETRKKCQSDGIVAVISGNFTQRGEPAVFDKWTRAEMALRSGVDLVLELPTVFAVRSAGYFAQGAVETLAATGVIDQLSCGVESKDPSSLKNLAEFLSHETPEFQERLLAHLKEGISYPAAQQKALQDLNIVGCNDLDRPNNILAVEYQKTIYKQNLSIDPVFISRNGDYRDSRLPDSKSQYASATAIRSTMMPGSVLWKRHVPNTVADIIMDKELSGSDPMTTNHFSQMLLMLLRRSTAEELSRITEFSEGLENRMIHASYQAQSFNELCNLVKSKRYPYSRIQRSCIHLLLNFTKDYEFNHPEYLRVLGFNKTGQKILKEMKTKSELPVLIRPARQQNELTKAGKKMFQLDCRATDIYMLAYQLLALRNGGLDLTKLPVQV